jgi:hypothetical protein
MTFWGRGRLVHMHPSGNRANTYVGEAKQLTTVILEWVNKKVVEPSTVDVNVMTLRIVSVHMYKLEVISNGLVIRYPPTSKSHELMQIRKSFPVSCLSQRTPNIGLVLWTMQLSVS